MPRTDKTSSPFASHFVAAVAAASAVAGNDDDSVQTARSCICLTLAAAAAAMSAVAAPDGTAVDNESRVCVKTLRKLGILERATHFFTLKTSLCAL